MPSLDRILLPVDFSGRCQGAVRYAEALAAQFGSELMLLHVLPPPHYEFSALEVGGSVLNELFASRAAHVRKELNSYMERELQDVVVKRVLLEGDPARCIVGHAHAERVGLIVMPTHGYGPFRRFILGSVTAKVLHDADCPVLTGVHLEEAPPIESIAFRNVLVAIDLGDQSARTLEWANWLASSCGARLHLVHVTASIEGHAGEYHDPEWRDHLGGQVREEIAKLEQCTGTKAELVVESGDAPKVICKLAERIKADVLVIGRGSAAGVFGRLRTNAYAIIRESPCPVASV
jgi:nucleotide-binding universal stress UspA family protein